MLARVSARLLQGLTDLACTVCRDERVSDGTPHWCHESNSLPVWCYKSYADSHATQAHQARVKHSKLLDSALPVRRAYAPGAAQPQ